MQICYGDEAGCTGVLESPMSPVQPVLVIAAVCFDQADLHQVTMDFLNLKQQYFPGSQLRRGNPPVSQSPQFFLDWVLPEVKGVNVRRNLWHGGRNRRRHSMRFLDHFVSFLESHDARIMGRVLIKGIGVPIKGRAVYTSAIQTIFSTLDDYLDQIDDQGFIVMDSRRKDQNVNVAHSLFTQKFRAAGDSHPRVLELPTFGHSDNHVGIQIADILCSGLLFPIAAHSYCAGHVNNVHVQTRYADLRPRFGLRLRALQHRFQVAGRWRGGIAVCDSLTQRSGGHLFV